MELTYVTAEEIRIGDTVRTHRGVRVVQTSTLIEGEVIEGHEQAPYYAMTDAMGTFCLQKLQAVELVGRLTPCADCGADRMASPKPAGDVLCVPCGFLRFHGGGIS